jgi:hypothetical protein
MASMASGTTGEAWRHLCDLFSDETSVGLGDGLLLARYAGAPDEGAQMVSGAPDEGAQMVSDHFFAWGISLGQEKLN